MEYFYSRFSITFSWISCSGAPVGVLHASPYIIGECMGWKDCRTRSTWALWTQPSLLVWIPLELWGWSTLENAQGTLLCPGRGWIWVWGKASTSRMVENEEEEEETNIDNGGSSNSESRTTTEHGDDATWFILYLISWYMNSYFCLITKGLVPAIFVLLFSICTFYIFIFCIFSFHNSYSSLSPLNPLSHTKDDVSHTVQLPNLFSNTTCSFYILSHTYYSYCVSLVS